MPVALVLFDWDKTVFDTHHFMAVRRASLSAALGVSPEEFDAADRAYQATLPDSTAFEPEAYLRFIHSRLGGEASQLSELFWEPTAFTNSLYPETMTVIKDLKQAGFTMGSFSQGDKKFQEKKIYSSGLTDYFDHKYIIVEKQKNTPEILNALPTRTVIVDDRQDFLEIELAYPNLIPVWINRNNNDTWQQGVTIHTLNELPAVLLQLNAEG